jgi:hypothetical protein
MWNVVSLEPGRSFVWKSGMPGMVGHAHHSVDPVSTGTRATLRLGYEGLLGISLGSA